MCLDFAEKTSVWALDAIKCLPANSQSSNKISVPSLQGLFIAVWKMGRSVSLMLIFNCKGVLLSAIASVIMFSFCQITLHNEALWIFFRRPFTFMNSFLWQSGRSQSSHNNLIKVYSTDTDESKCSSGHDKSKYPLKMDWCTPLCLSGVSGACIIFAS